TLQLTADDGFNQPSQTITVTVLEEGTSTYDTWSTGSFANAVTDTAMTSDPDGDGRSNMMEFAFGTDPTLMDMGPLAIDGSRHGAPVAAVDTVSGGFALYFMRRDDHATSGITYTARFSDDLTSFEANDDSANPPEIVPGSSDGEYHVLKLPFPASLSNGNPARFGCVEVLAP
ncbi:MAG: hypothetical protein R3242_11465, partial [Akkermansiaceae bacterium]|nr:hypothetical protein [Akkermansiaceae bacterium]